MLSTFADDLRWIINFPDHLIPFGALSLTSNSTSHISPFCVLSPPGSYRTPKKKETSRQVAMLRPWSCRSDQLISEGAKLKMAALAEPNAFV
jgi:hypothetical protein